MTAFRRSSSTAATALIAAAAVILPASVGMAAERVPVLSYDFSGFGSSAPAPQDIDPAPAEPTLAAIDERQLTCVAKVVHHEASNQSRTGQMAVAQTLIHRLKAGGRFGNTLCEVANQPGQYFQTARYRPRKDETWEEAVDVARDAMAGGKADVVPGALFFRASYAAPTTFFRSLERVTAVGDHVFYR